MPSTDEKLEKLSFCIEKSKELDGQKFRAKDLMVKYGYSKRTSPGDTFLKLFTKTSYEVNGSFWYYHVFHARPMRFNDFMEYFAESRNIHWQNYQVYIAPVTLYFAPVKDLPFYILEEFGGWISDNLLKDFFHEKPNL